jgi:AP-1 complex subunit sigma 1/2
MIRFILLLSRQGKVRLSKWYTTVNQKERAKIIRELTPLVLSRPLKLCNFLDWKDTKVVYKRYASLYFVAGVEADDNELITLEVIHHFVEVLDRYFGNVCELDLIFNFHKAYFMLDEMLLAGELQEPSKKAVSRVIEVQDQLVESAKLGGGNPASAGLAGLALERTRYS